MPWLTQLIHQPVTGRSGRRLGRVHDLVATRGRFPRVVGIAVSLDRAGREEFSSQRADHSPVFVPWDSFVGSLAHARGGFVLSQTPAAGAEPSDGLHLRADLLDLQIVDTEGARVVRVNDVLLAESARGLRVVGADVGLRGALRRFGLERAAERLLDALGYQLPERLIAWNYVAPISESPREVRLTVPTRILRELHPSELADILDQLDATRRERIIRVMTDSALAETLPETEPEVTKEAIELLGEERSRRVLALMPPDEATDLLGAVGYEAAERLLGLMGVRQASVLRELLGYPPDTAGGRMTPSFVGIPATATAQDAIEVLRSEAGRAETIYYAYVLDGQGRLEGVLSLRELLRAAPDKSVEELMERDVVSAHLGDDQEEVARAMTRHNLLAVPVVDDNAVLRGIVTVDDVVNVMEEEASEDLSEVTGVYLGEGPGANTGRLAGFGLSMAAGIAAAALLHAQRSVLAGIAAVAWLLPLYLRMAQDLGTWSLARALAVDDLGVGKRAQVLAQELTAALLSAGAAGLLVGVFGALWSRQIAVGAFLGAGLFVGSLSASMIGLVLPSLTRGLRRRRILDKGRPLAITVGLAGVIVYVWALSSLAGRLH